jgi:hypothetical protein
MNFPNGVRSAQYAHRLISTIEGVYPEIRRLREYKEWYLENGALTKELDAHNKVLLNLEK